MILKIISLFFFSPQLLGRPLIRGAFSACRAVILQSRHLPDAGWWEKQSFGVRKVREKSWALQQGEDGPKFRTSSEIQEPPSPWCRFGVEGQTASPKRSGNTSCCSTCTQTAPQPFPYAKDLLLGFGSCLCTSNTLQVSNFNIFGLLLTFPNPRNSHFFLLMQMQEILN